MDVYGENILKKVMPHDDDAERAVLTSMLLSPKAIQEVQEIIKAGDEFYNNIYGIIFDTIVDMENSGGKADPVTLKDKLSEKDLPPEVASLPFIMDIMKDSSSSTSANVTYYADIVHKKAESRSLINAAEQIAEQGYKDDLSVQDLFDTAEKKIFEATQSRIVRDVKPIKEIFYEALTNVSKAYRMQGQVTGVSTGFSDLDYMTSGFQRSDFILIAASHPRASIIFSSCSAISSMLRPILPLASRSVAFLRTRSAIGESSILNLSSIFISSSFSHGYSLKTSATFVSFVSSIISLSPIMIDPSCRISAVPEALRILP